MNKLPYLLDTVGHKYLCLNNRENINCYFITAIQILHSSDIFTNLIKQPNNKEYLKKSFPSLFNPIYAYEDIDNYDIQTADKVLYNIEESIKDYPPAIRDGYDWLKMLNFYYLPISWSLLKNDEQFINMLNEMSIEPRMLARQPTTNFSFLFNADELIPIYNEYYNNIDSIYEKYDKSNLECLYNCTALETYKDEVYGHVFPIINNNGSLFVSDNHQLISLYEYVFKDKLINADKLRLNYYSPKLLNLYNDSLHLEGKYKFVENQYSLILREFDKACMHTRYKDDGANNKIIYPPQPRQTKITGGNNAKNEEIILFYISLFLFVVAVVIAVIYYTKYTYLKKIMLCDVN